MLLVHGTYQPEVNRFVLWAESSETHGSRRRRPPAPHPFAVTHEQLLNWLERFAPMLTPESIKLSLSSGEKQPPASPE